MTPSLKDSVAILQTSWRLLSKVPGGGALFVALLGRIVPYSGTVRPEILELAPGRAKIAMGPRRITRNHLGSAHALALANLGELACGLALHMALPPGYRAILSRIDVEFVRKARGTVVSQCNLGSLVFDGDSELVAESQLTDPTGTLVARATTAWRIGPGKGTQQTSETKRHSDDSRSARVSAA